MALQSQADLKHGHPDPAPALKEHPSSSSGGKSHSFETPPGLNTKLIPALAGHIQAFLVLGRPSAKLH